ncbi:hypothetical protein EBT25_17785 [bacterium]|nr:hypothetical protein [bacterium]
MHWHNGVLVLTAVMFATLQAGKPAKTSTVNVVVTTTIHTLYGLQLISPKEIIFYQKPVM